MSTIAISIIAATIVLVVGSFLLRGRGSREMKSTPETLQIAPGISATVVNKVDPSSEFLCSKCYQTYPMSEVHVVPTFIGDREQYVGSYRCNKDWKATVAETRQQAKAHEPRGKDAVINSIGSFVEVFRNRGVSDEELQRLVGGKRSDDVIPILLDALESGAIILKP